MQILYPTATATTYSTTAAAAAAITATTATATTTTISLSLHLHTIIIIVRLLLAFVSLHFSLPSSIFPLSSIIDSIPPPSPTHKKNQPLLANWICPRCVVFNSSHPPLAPPIYTHPHRPAPGP
ncbi:hypothetical protein EDC01DRAFT_627681 [Geopyxis carbonaria]|nr:hypothetical protein EDC01DRAFT_627681 [Geopyxis carbonaria]